ncbi:MAG TPA: PEGA domain-containing protein [Labilithrix sp.]|jgi:hypothetical protein
MRRALLPSIVAAAIACATMPSSAAAQDSDPREKSRTAFKRCVAQLKSQDWAGARASCEQAYALFAHPSILLNLGIARLRTGDPVLAEQDLVKFLSDDAGSPPEELAAARDALAEARGQLGTMRVQVTPDAARVTIDGKAIQLVRREAAGDVVAESRVKAGKHSIVVEADGYSPQTREVSVTAKRDADVNITLQKSSAAPTPGAEPSETRTIIGWSLVGLAGAGAVTSVVTALRAKSLADQYKDPSSSRFQDSGTRSTGITFRTAADIAGGVAILAAAGAIVLLFTDIGAGGTASAVSGRSESRAAVLRW